MEDLRLTAEHLAEPFYEPVGRRERDIVVELFEDLELESQDLFLCIRVVWNVNKLTNFRWSDLLVLARDEHGCDAEELILWSGDTLALTIPVNQVDSDVERFMLHVILAVYLDKPWDEYWAMALGDVWLDRANPTRAAM